MLLTTIGHGEGGGVDTHSMTLFIELLNIIHENDFFNLKIILVPSSYISLLT